MPSQFVAVRVVKPALILRAVACAVSALVAAPLAAQTGWAQIATTGPGARSGHAMAYDSQRGKTELFGGGNLHDTWEWDGGTWTQVATTGPGTNSSGYAMAYDSQRGRTVLFGGASTDTWEWDGITWTQTQVPTTGPAPRSFHAMVYDSQRGRVVLFGGQHYNSLSILGDTWEWNGIAWTQVAATGPARRKHRIAYDSQRGRVVLFGGYNGTSLGDTWEWDGATWTQVATTGPGARYFHAMAYDSVLGRTVLFGGQDYYSGLVGDTWLWNGSGWAQVATANGPAPREGHAMVYDSQRGRVVLFGGQGGNQGDTWEWNVIPGSAFAYSSGCGNPALSLSPVANARPALGATAQATLTNIPSPLAFVALGWSNTTAGPFPLPFPLVWYGMPGCYMLQSCEAAAQPVSFTGGPSTATYSLSLPNWAGLIGLHLYLQGWANAPGANAGNAIVSNGLEWVIGY